MKIAFFAYPSAFQSPGGGEILLLKSKESLEAKGISVKLFDQWSDKLKDYDILHVFGTEKDSLGLMRTAKSVNIKIALSPVFWSTMQRALHEYGGASRKINMVLRHATKVILPTFPSARRKMCQLADIILPNSEAEADQVARLFAIDRYKMEIVYLAADKRFASADKSEFIEKYNIRDFILSVGRIEPRKNQLNLIRAMKGTGKKLVLIGDPISGYENYYNECKKEADENTAFIPRIDHASSLLSSAYAACSVFVLQGWFETPGLVALEAALSGARLAVTEGGSTREYFKDYAEYLNPASPLSIRDAINKTSERPYSGELKKCILNNFLWSDAADANLKVYNKLLKLK